jgi:hypothetical protein
MAALKQASAEESQERSEEEELFRRLDELEMEEELQDELAKYDFERLLITFSLNDCQMNLVSA